MTAITFDTLTASRKLRDAGIDEQTAVAIVEVVSQSATLPNIEHLATKDDLKVLQAELRADFREALRQQALTLAGFMVAVAGLAVAIARLFPAS